ncbi:hypothetical protein LTR44_002089 [Exophiala sp. CCFEE 6388]|nr:hypothetical protein LTR44_002089 [Eurotiomycetes sp. CCFEE 6388]
MSATEVRVDHNSGGGSSTMKAVNYQGAFKVKVEDVPLPKIEHPDDVLVKVTTADHGRDGHGLSTGFDGNDKD